MCADTIRPPETYKGYRLFISQMEVVKRGDDWTRIRFMAVNTGRNDINFSKKGTEHWVQFQFDNSLYDSGLGGMRDQIRYAFYRSGFKLKAGKTARHVELKVDLFETPVSIQAVENTRANPAGPAPVIHFKTGTDTLTHEELARRKIQCPDLIIEDISVKNMSKKRATIELTIANVGEGPFDLLELTGHDRIKLSVRAYISGVPTLTKGALAIGGGSIGEELDGKNITLYPGDRYQTSLRLDVRAKTRYLKTLILSLDTNRVPYECDRTNNTAAIELE
ncbi:MAG: hypothetical protein D6714_03030 [Bacteroidetes bacterium]|nr:MAG: hypothetical protein D6714_03030 [Bacteroidota bacterium]